MKCSINDLYKKEVININTGCRIGYVNDAIIDTADGNIISLNVVCYGKQIFSKHNDINICWKDIAVIGNETILVHHTQKEESANSNRKLFDIFAK